MPHCRRHSSWRIHSLKGLLGCEDETCTMPVRKANGGEGIDWGPGGWAGFSWLELIDKWLEELPGRAAEGKQRGLVFIGAFWEVREMNVIQSISRQVFWMGEPHLTYFLLSLFILLLWIQSLVENVYYECKGLWQSQILSAWHGCPSFFLVLLRIVSSLL